MLDVAVIDDPAVAGSVLDPVRTRILAELAEPASAAELAPRLGIPRQKINYHLRTLESHGLVTVAETRRWGGLTERILVATAASYVVSPGAMGPLTSDPARATDRLSARYLIALAARTIRELSDLLRRAHAAKKELAALSIDTEIRFRSAADRAAFTRDLTNAITTLVAQHHDPSAIDGRDHRLIVAAYPKPKAPTAQEN